MKRINPLWPLFLVIFIDTLGYFIVMPVLARLYFHSHFLGPHFSIHERYWIYSITLMLSPLAFITLSPIAGRASDLIGRKRVIGACLIGSLFGFILPIIGILHHKLSLILIGRFIAGAGTTSQPVAQAAITDFSTGKTRAFNLSLIGLAMTLAMTIGPLSGAYLSDPHLISWFNNTTPYLFGTILAVVNLILLFYLFTDTRTKATLERHKKVNKWRLFNRFVVTLLLSFLLLEIAWSLYYQASYLFLPRDFHFTTNQISLFASYAGLCMSIGLTLVYKLLLRYFSIKKIALYSLMIITCGFLLLLPQKTIVAHWILVGPIALGFGTAYPSILEIISENTPADHQGWMLGVASTILGFAWMITGLFSGSIVDSYQYLCVLLCFFSILFSLLLYLPTKAKNNETHQ